MEQSRDERVGISPMINHETDEGVLCSTILERSKFVREFIDDIALGNKIKIDDQEMNDTVENTYTNYYRQGDTPENDSKYDGSNEDESLYDQSLNPNLVLNNHEDFSAEQMQFSSSLNTEESIGYPASLQEPRRSYQLYDSSVYDHFGDLNLNTPLQNEFSTINTLDLQHSSGSDPSRFGLVAEPSRASLKKKKSKKCNAALAGIAHDHVYSFSSRNKDPMLLPNPIVAEDYSSEACFRQTDDSSSHWFNTPDASNSQSWQPDLQHSVLNQNVFEESHRQLLGGTILESPGYNLNTHTNSPSMNQNISGNICIVPFSTDGTITLLDDHDDDRLSRVSSPYYNVTSPDNEGSVLLDPQSPQFSDYSAVPSPSNTSSADFSSHLSLTAAASASGRSKTKASSSVGRDQNQMIASNKKRAPRMSLQGLRPEEKHARTRTQNNEASRNYRGRKKENQMFLQEQINLLEQKRINLEQEQRNLEDTTESFKRGIGMIVANGHNGVYR